MSDDSDMEMIFAKRMPVSRRFIEQAYQYLHSTGERSVDLLVIPEVPIEGALTCGGVSTKQPLPVPRIAGPTETSTQWTLGTLSDSVILDVITTQGPISTRLIGDSLGIPGKDISLRQRVRRVVDSLLKGKQIRPLGDKRFPKYALSAQARPQGPSAIKRKDITIEKVVEQLATGPMTSRMLADKLGIPRHDNHVRAKITEHIRTLRQNGRVRQIHTERKGERIYELTAESEAATA